MLVWLPFFKFKTTYKIATKIGILHKLAHVL